MNIIIPMNHNILVYPYALRVILTVMFCALFINLYNSLLRDFCKKHKLYQNTIIQDTIVYNTGVLGKCYYFMDINFL